MSDAYAAAGILVFRRGSDNAIEVLMQIEENWGSKRCKFHAPPRSVCWEGEACRFLHISSLNTSPDERTMLRLNFLGGKREDVDAAQSARTAAREFSEETKGLVSPVEAARFIQQSDTVELHAPGDYRLFLVADRSASLPAGLLEYYRRLPMDPPLACAVELVWVAMEDIQRLLPRPSPWDADLGYHMVLHATRRVAITNLVWATLAKQGTQLSLFASTL